MNKNEICDELITRYPSILPIKSDILQAESTIAESYRRGGKLLLCGNGGSCADCAHIVGELMKNFKYDRAKDNAFTKKLEELGEDFGDKLERSLPAISLCANDALMTAFSNDSYPELVFAQQVYGYGKKDDVLFAISTSGKSKNCVYAAAVAKAVGMKIIALTGSNKGRLSELADVTVNVPETETFKVQELHLPIYHAICAMLEAEFFLQ